MQTSFQIDGGFGQQRQSDSQWWVWQWPGAGGHHIPLTNRTSSSEEGYTTENGVTVLNFNKSKHVVCDKC